MLNGNGRLEGGVALRVDFGIQVRGVERDGGEVDCGALMERDAGYGSGGPPEPAPPSRGSVDGSNGCSTPTDDPPSGHAPSAARHLRCSVGTTRNFSH